MKKRGSTVPDSDPALLKPRWEGAMRHSYCYMYDGIKIFDPPPCAAVNLIFFEKSDISYFSECMVVARRQNGDIAILEPSGKMDLFNCQDITEYVDILIAQKTQKVVINLQGVTYIDSWGWGTLLTTLSRLKENGGDMKLSNISTYVNKVFKLSELDARFNIYPSESEAIHSFNGS